jgi:CPA2 family monovalent cation:H+ antiporter-2
VAALRSRELFVVAVATVALGTAYVASLLGISLALGAFVAGVAVGESDLSHRILAEALPLRDIFAGLFFVSVGMLVDPAFIAGNVPLVLLGTALIVLGKGACTFLVARLLGYTVRTALLVAAGLAQCAEFSFLMARLGLDLGVVDPATFNLMLTGAAASIVLSPALYGLAWRAAPRVERRFGVVAALAAPSRAGADEGALPQGHAVLCGYGRVGRTIGSILADRGIPLVVIDQDERVVRGVRSERTPALVGDASSPVVLERANVRTARVIVVAVPDPLAVRLVVDWSRHAVPAIDVVARTHSEAERLHLYRLGATEVVMGEIELALEMTRHTLRRFDVAADEAERVLAEVRRGSLPDPAEP